MEILTIDLETVIKAEEAIPGAYIKNNGLNYVSLEFLCSVIEQTVEVNIDEPDKVQIMSGLMAAMEWAPKLLGYMTFQDQLQDLGEDKS